MKPKDRAWIDRRLEAWGLWVTEPLAGIGYRSETVESLLMLYGGDVPRSTGGQRGTVPYMGNSDAAEINRIVAEFNQSDRAIIDVRYVYCIDGVEAAEMIGMSKTTFYRKLGKLQERIFGEVCSGE